MADKDLIQLKREISCIIQQHELDIKKAFLNDVKWDSQLNSDLSADKIIALFVEPEINVNAEYTAERGQEANLINNEQNNFFKHE